MHHLHPAVKTVWRIQLGLFLAFVVMAAIGYEILQFFADDRFFPFGVLSGALMLSSIGLGIGLPAFRYRYWQYDLRDEELYLERGIFNRVRTIVPLRRVQHLDVSQNLIEREYNLGKLIVHTAGTRSSDVILPGLLIEEAEQLRDTVKRYILDDTL